GSFRFTCVHHEVISRIRHDRRSRSIDEQDADGTPILGERVLVDPRAPTADDIALARQRTAEIAAALDALPPDQRTFVELRYVQKRKVKVAEIAKTLGVSVKEAYRIGAKARTRLSQL